MLGIHQAPQGRGTAPKLPELLGRGGIVGLAVQGQELDSVIPLGPFQPRIFHNFSYRMLGHTVQLWVALQAAGR